MRHNARPVALTTHGARVLMRRIRTLALLEARRGAWRANHRLCREHDDLAVAYPKALRYG